MPAFWHDKFAAAKMQEDWEFNRSIVANRKPYFMCYIYPNLMKEYKHFRKQTARNGLRQFGLTPDEMLALPEAELTDEQREFLRYYRLNMPVGVGDCVVNRICRRFEQEFDGYLKQHKSEVPFDFSILKSGESYPAYKKSRLADLYLTYNQRLQLYTIASGQERLDKQLVIARFIELKEDFTRECSQLCSNERELCDILLDICYKSTRTKKFVWSICGESIIKNMLSRNDGVIRFPMQSPDGDHLYADKTFKIVQIQMPDDSGEGVELNDPA